MPFANDSLTQIFPGLTVSNGNVTIPSGTINSFIPSSAQSGVQDFIWGLIDTLSTAVSSGLPTNITVTEGSSLPNAATLRKTYNFVVNLDYDAASVEEVLDVKQG